MIGLMMKSYNTILKNNQQKYLNYHQVNLIQMNILRSGDITFHSRSNDGSSQIYLFSSRKNVWKWIISNWGSKKMSKFEALQTLKYANH